MKRHKSIGPMLRSGEPKFWTPVNFEVEYFLNEETEGVLTDTVIYFSDQHWRPQGGWSTGAMAPPLAREGGAILSSGPTFDVKGKR